MATHMEEVFKLQKGLYCKRKKNKKQTCPLGWVCRIHWLHLCRGVRVTCIYTTKQSEIPVMQELGECGELLHCHRSQDRKVTPYFKTLIYFLTLKSYFTGYDTKRSDCEAPVMLELWGMRSTPSLPSLLGPFRPGVVAPDRVPSMGQIELIYKLMLGWIAWYRTVLICKLYIHA